VRDPAWLIEARRHVGLREITGPKHEPKITAWLKRLGAWWNDDEQPWCGTFVAAMLSDAGLQPPRHWYRAKAYLDWGRKMDCPEIGCIVVFARGGGGHVGFVVGRDLAGNLMVLGGNQGNAVTIAPFSTQRVIGYRWPVAVPLPAAWPLPLLASGRLSTSEA